MALYLRLSGSTPPMAGDRERRSNADHELVPLSLATDLYY